MSKPNRIVLVGHCAADVWSLKMALAQAAPGVPIETLADAKSLDNADLSDCLLLVNRRLPASFAAADGIELISRLSHRPGPPAMMLISNFPDAQAQAEQAGALPGFGKNELTSEQSLARLRAAMGR